MTELWLKFKDEKGEMKRLLVGKESFIIGRHSENDLSVPNGKLSREHLKINRFGDLFMVSDAGSSNGTTLNGKPLDEPTAVRHGDILDLGGGLKIKVEIESDDPNAAAPPAAQPIDAAAGGVPGGDGQVPGAGVPGADGQVPASGVPGANVTGVPSSPAAANGGAVPAAPATGSVGAMPAAPGAVNAGAVSAVPAAGGSGFPKLVFILAPLFVIIVLIFVGGLFLVFSGGDDAYRDNRDDDFVYSNDNSNDDDDNSNTKDVVTTKTPSNSTDADATPTPGGTNTQPTPADPGGSGKVEQNAASFLRKVADNDPRAFLTGDQAKIVDGKIKQLSSSSTLAENIKSANRSSAQIKTLAASKNLQPQLLATAAIAKLGGSRGDVLQTAQSMAEVLGKLGTQIGTERSDDSLLLIAAYDQGQAGEFLKMRNMLQALAGKSTESSRAIRSIWFLQKNNKITASEFEFALRFLAIGTITQNPKDFGVNTDALGF